MNKKPWRPDDYENPYKWTPQDTRGWKHSHDVYEASADALLGALRKAGFHITTGQTLEIEGKYITATRNQTLALIPDD